MNDYKILSLKLNQNLVGLSGSLNISGCARGSLKIFCSEPLHITISDQFSVISMRKCCKILNFFLFLRNGVWFVPTIQTNTIIFILVYAGQLQSSVFLDDNRKFVSQVSQLIKLFSIARGRLTNLAFHVDHDGFYQRKLLSFCSLTQPIIRRLR